MKVHRMKRDGKPFHTMTGFDATRCLTAADDASPAKRGYAWLKAFLSMARWLGYRREVKPVCRCGCRGLRPECGLVRPAEPAHVGTGVGRG